MPQSSTFPASTDNDNSLYLVVNNLRTRLTSNISDVTTTIPVVTTSGFPEVGFLTILTGADITNSEAMAYSGTDSTNFFNVERGSDGTPALEHVVGDNVDHTVVARHHNNLKDAIISLEEFIGNSNSPNFVPKDGFGNVVITGTLDVTGDIGTSGSLLVIENTTLSGALDAGYVAVTGTLNVCDAAVFKHNVNVSGCLFVGDIFVSSTPNTQYVLEDTNFNSTSTFYVDIGVETDSMVSGNNLLFFGASAGSTGSSPGVNLRCQFDGATIGEANDITVNGTGPWGGTNLSGWKMVIGDGVASAKLQVGLATGASNTDVSAASIMSIPLDDMGLVENTDYWFTNGSDTSTAITTTSGLVTIGSLTTTSLDAGNYLVFGYMESGANSSTCLTHSRFYMDGNEVGSAWSRLHQVGGAGLRSTVFVRQLTLAPGPHTFEARGQVFFANDGLFRRANLAIVKADAFDQTSGFRSETSQVSNTSAYEKITSSEITYTPNQEETLLVFANPTSSIGSAAGEVVAYKLANETDDIDYMIDVSNLHRDTANETHGTLLFTKLDNVYAPHTFSLAFREPEGTGNNINHINVNMVVWGLSTTLTSGTQFTTIKGSQITTPKLYTDSIEVINGGTLTVSGEPVVISLPNAVVDLQTAYDNGNGIIGTQIGKPVVVSGTVADGDVDFKVVGSGIFTEAIAVGETFSTTVDNHSITTNSGIFSDRLTVSGLPVDLEGGPITVREGDSFLSIANVKTIVVSNGTLTDDGGGQVTILTGAGTALSVQEQDGTPTVTGVNTIKVTNSALTDEGSGVVSLNFSTGGGAAAGGDFSGALITTSGITADNGGEFIVTWTGSVYDTDNYFDIAQQSRLTVNKGDITHVRLKASGHILALTTPAVNDSYVFTFLQNGALTFPELRAKNLWTGTTTSSRIIQATSFPIPVTSGDYFELAYQDGNGDSNLLDNRTWFSIEDATPRVALSGGGTANTLQDAYDNGDGTLSTTGGKPFELTGTGELVAITGTFTSGLTIGTDSTVIDGKSITTASGIFDSLTVSGIPINLGFPTDGAFRGAVVRLSAPQTLTNSVAANIAWDTEIIDTDGFWDSGAPTDLVIPGGITKIRLSAMAEFESNAAGRRQGVMLRNGAFDAQSLPNHTQNATSGDRTGFQVLSAPISVSEGDVFVFRVFQTSGGDLDFNDIGSRTWFALEVLEPNTIVQDDIVSISGSFSQSLTISGVPVNTHGFRGALATITTGTNVPDNEGISIGFDDLQYDTDSLFDNGIFVVPAGVGYMRVSFFVQWDTDADVSERSMFVQWFAPDQTQLSTPAADRRQANDGQSSTDTRMTCISPVLPVSGGQTFRPLVRQDGTGSTKTINSSFTGAWFQAEILG